MTKRLWLGRPRCDKCKRECVGDYYVCAACIEAPLAALRERAEAAEGEVLGYRTDRDFWREEAERFEAERDALKAEVDALRAQLGKREEGRCE